MSDFNFIDGPIIPEDETPQYVGPNISKVSKMTPRKFAQSVLEVFDKLGGASWLLMQATVDPKGFLDLLKKLIPKSVQLEDLQGIQINLIDQFGNEVAINTGAPRAQSQPKAPVPAADAISQEPGHLQIATGGNPPPAQKTILPEQEALSPDYEINIKDIFE
jgi:hypothetical protein